MSNRTITIVHDGETYSGEIATIRRTELGREDHGIMTAFLHTEWQGGGVSVGGMGLDEPFRDTDGRFVERRATAYGLDHIMRLIDTVGVASWEKLAGAKCIVLFPVAEERLGMAPVGVAGLDNDRVLNLREHAIQWTEEENN